MRKVLFGFMGLLLLSPVWPQSFELQKINVGVMRLEARQGISPMLVNLINELMCSTIPQLGDYWVINTDILYDSLKSMPDKNILNCQQKQCYLEMGEYLQVTYLIVGSIARRDTVYTVNIVMLDVDNDEVFSRITKTYTGEETGLVEQLEKWTFSLFKIKTEEEKQQEAEEAARKVAEEPKEFKMDFIDFGDLYDIVRFSGPDSNDLSYSLGYTFNQDVSGFDPLYVSFRHANFVIGLDVNLFENELLVTESSDGSDYKSEGIEKLKGAGLAFGYQWLELLYGFVTVTPGISLGWYTVERELDVWIKQTGQPDSSYEYMSPSKSTPQKGVIGINCRIDVGKKITPYFKLTAFLFEQWLYLPDIISLLNIGVQGSYCFDLTAKSSGKSASP